MKISKKIKLIFGAFVCAGLLCTAGNSVMAAEEYDADTYGPEELIVWQKPVPKVAFSHKIHTMDAGLACDSCHDDLFQMEAGAASEKDDFTMKSFKDGKYCGACHDGGSAFDANLDETCKTCHTPPKSIVFTKPVKAVIFDHTQHMGDMGCTSCHNKLFTMKIGAAEEQADKFVMDALYKGEYCGACHNGEDAFASNTRCTVCHIGVKGHSRLFGTQETDSHGHSAPVKVEEHVPRN